MYSEISVTTKWSQTSNRPVSLAQTRKYRKIYFGGSSSHQNSMSTFLILRLEALSVLGDGCIQYVHRFMYFIGIV